MKIYTTKSRDQVFLDDDDFEKLIVKMDYTYYVLRNKKRKIKNVCRNISFSLSDTRKQNSQLLHWDIMGHPEKGMVTDHIDGNPLNNQKDNLRICSYRENNQNYRYKTNTRNYSSLYPGVCWDKRNNKWRSCININNVQKYLGLFLKEEDAAKAYQNACKKLKGNK